MGCLIDSHREMVMTNRESMFSKLCHSSRAAVEEREEATELWPSILSTRDKEVVCDARYVAGACLNALRRLRPPQLLGRVAFSHDQSESGLPMWIQGYDAWQCRTPRKSERDGWVGRPTVQRRPWRVLDRSVKELSPVVHHPCRTKSSRTPSISATLL